MNSNFIEDNLYRKIVENTVVSTVDVIIFSKDQKKVLLFLRSKEPVKGIYYSLGGRMKKNEKPVDCAIRKMKSEIDIDVNKIRLNFAGVVYEFFDNSYFSNSISSNFINLVYSYTIDNKISDFEKETQFDDQHESFKWFAVDHKDIHKYVKRKIKLCLKSEKQDWV